MNINILVQMKTQVKNEKTKVSGSVCMMEDEVRGYNSGSLEIGKASRLCTLR